MREKGAANSEKKPKEICSRHLCQVGSTNPGKDVETLHMSR